MREAAIVAAVLALVGCVLPPAELKAMVDARYYKLEIGGRELVEIDVENMIRRVDGVDQLEAQRNALGL